MQIHNPLFLQHCLKYVVMNLVGNLIWIFCGGLASALGYAAAGIAFCATIIGIPFGLQCFKIALFVLWPFGSKVAEGQSSSGCLSLLFNIIWIFTGGIYTALVHIVFALLLFITIIGIPFARKHLQLAALAFAPFGKRIVEA